MLEKYFHLPIVIVYSDGEGEYEAFKQTFLILKVQHLVSPPHIPQLINTVECRHCHIVEIGLILLHRASLLLSLWTFAFQITTYLINRLPLPILQFLSPFEKLFSQSPNYLKLHVFGCLCYSYLHPYTKHKLEPSSRPCVFLDYSTIHNSYRCFDISNHIILNSRHVVFVENSFLFQNSDFHLPRLSTTCNQWTATNSSHFLVPIHFGQPFILGPPLVNVTTSTFLGPSPILPSNDLSTLQAPTHGGTLLAPTTSNDSNSPSPTQV